MSELFKTTQKPLPPKTPDYFEIKYQTTIKAVGGGWFLDNMDDKLPPIKRRRLRKSSKSKKTKSKKIFGSSMIIVMVGGSNYIGTSLNE